MAGTPKGTEDAKQAGRNGMPLASKHQPKKSGSKGYSRKSSRK